MNILTLDFETFYSREFSLTKLTTEEYVRSDDFETIGVSVKENDNEAVWFSGTHDEISKFLYSFSWCNSFALAHNAMFDSAILSWRFGIKPMAWLDTLSMARATDGLEAGNSLAKLVDRYSLGQKGTEVLNAIGKRRQDFSTFDLHAYGEYCINDVELTYKLFHVLVERFLKSELQLISLTTKMFSEPVLKLNTPLLEQHLMQVKTRKEKLLAACISDKDTLMSNPKLAELLISLGVEPPMKISPANGKDTYAFAKNDEGFKELANYPDERVQAIVAARLGTKSTLEETRTQRFINISLRGDMPVPLRYYAAHTGRWGGDDKLNLQNLPRKSLLKDSIIAPKGFILIDADSSQIEARIVAWLSGQQDLVDAFERKEDVYKIMASSIYNKAVKDITSEERFVGKTTILGCIAEQTPVLCKSGWKLIEQLSLEDELWDGEEWVCHQGLVMKGIKETLNVCGSWLTQDHKILCGTQWKEAQLVAQEPSILYQALGIGVENLPLQATFEEYEVESWQSLLNVVAMKRSIPLIDTTLKVLRVLDVTYAQSMRQMKSVIGFIQRQCQTMGIGLDFLIGYPRQLVGATTKQMQTISTMEQEVSTYVKSGGKTKQSFLYTPKHYPIGKYPNTKWTGQITTKVMSQTTLGSLTEKKTCGIEEVLSPLRKRLQTYDIAYSGPRNRFTILTNSGPLIVHNCGYGMGSTKFGVQLKTFGVEIADAEASRIIEVYRSRYPFIPQLWKEAGRALDALTDKKTCKVGAQPQAITLTENGFLLPSGLYLNYKDLRKSSDDFEGYSYASRRGRIKIYGGKIVENICQALARCVIGEQMLRISKRYKVALTVQDAVMVVVREEEKEDAMLYVEECMKWRPLWAQTLPLACEIGVGKSYGEC